MSSDLTTMFGKNKGTTLATSVLGLVLLTQSGCGMFGGGGTNVLDMLPAVETVKSKFRHPTQDRTKELMEVLKQCGYTDDDGNFPYSVVNLMNPSVEQACRNFYEDHGGEVANGIKKDAEGKYIYNTDSSIRNIKTAIEAKNCFVEIHSPATPGPVVPGPTAPGKN